MNKADKQEALDKVASDIAATQGGPLKATGINPVPGEGNPDAKILFIGEAPGFNENEQKRPFVGQSGKLLRKNLEAHGLPAEEVYITNIVKFRPPDNRDPSPSEIEFFRPFLDRQIEIIDPLIVVTLGRYSMYKFLGEDAKISKIHGLARKINWQGKTLLVYPMFHPAAALRDSTTMRLFEADFTKLKDLLTKADKIQDEIAEEKKEDRKQAEQLSLI